MLRALSPTSAVTPTTPAATDSATRPRSLHAEADLHVLDEPTTALDAPAEHQVFNQFRNLKVGHATLLITHRLAKARIADRIAVMDHGRINESGSLQQLLAQSGRSPSCTSSRTALKRTTPQPVPGSESRCALSAERAQ
ncbi:hypothetical protein [Streptomyces chartreusis]|uniref:hypothetical protein n=1 Tax=Streptomyces chartreusis TaxID=1969 RepID=UPI00363972DD